MIGEKKKLLGCQLRPPASPGHLFNKRESILVDSLDKRLAAKETVAQMQDERGCPFDPFDRLPHPPAPPAFPPAFPAHLPRPPDPPQDVRARKGRGNHEIESTRCFADFSSYFGAGKG
eukprot:1388208-Amorphochlora_amoeboformis.AAC.1